MTLAQDLAALRWLLLSPPLLADAAMPEGVAVQRFCADEAARISAWIDWLEAEPQALIDCLVQARASTGGVYARGCEPLRLGRLAERLLEFFLNHGPLHRLAASNLPVRSTHPNGDRTTAGEIDFLLHSPSGQALHWELAVKYFLCQTTGHTAEPSDFLGPDSAETFDHKLHKMTQRQLQLKPPAPFDVSDWQPQAFVRGWMFYRFGKPVPHCSAMTLDHLRGWWLPLAECDALPGDAMYTELPRGAWMPAHRQPNQAGLWQAHDVARHLGARWQEQQHNSPVPHAFARIQRAQQAAQKPSARLIAGLQEISGVWREVRRYFVTPP